MVGDPNDLLHTYCFVMTGVLEPSAARMLCIPRKLKILHQNAPEHTFLSASLYFSKRGAY